jgi:metallo-beta-lactamase class B
LPLRARDARPAELELFPTMGCAAARAQRWNARGSRHFRAIGLAILILCIATDGPEANGARMASTAPVSPCKIIGNIYFIGANHPTFFISTVAGGILLNCGSEYDAAAVERNLTKLGFALRDVKIFLNTEGDGEHAGGTAVLKEKTGGSPKVIALQGVADVLARGGRVDSRFISHGAFPAIPVDRILQDGERLDLGESTLVAHASPGGAKGSATWTMKVREGAQEYDVVFLGDVACPTDGFLENADAFTVALEKAKMFTPMKMLRCDVFLAPRSAPRSWHSKIDRLKAGESPNPFIDADGYRLLIEKLERKYLARLERARQGLNGDGASLDALDE